MSLRSTFAMGAVGLVLALASCSDDDDAMPPPTAPGSDSGTRPPPVVDAGIDAPGPPDTGAEQDATPSGFTLTSSAYAENGTIPRRHECDPPGENVSPPLAWTPGPAGTMSYAIVMRDLDYRPEGAPFIHWVIWDIPGTATSLAENVPPEAAPDGGAKQAAFNETIIGYQGPCSPGRVNRYEITLYAIPTATISGLAPTTEKKAAAAAIVEVAIGATKLTGRS